MNKKKVAIIGASYLQLPLVMKAKEMGIEIHCFAWEKDAVCKEYVDFFYPISILEKERILEECKRVGIDGITTIATDMAIPTISYISNELNLVGNSIESACLSTCKNQMRHAFQKNGILSPKFQEIKDPVELDLNELNFPLIVKPIDRSGSLGVTKVESLRDLSTAMLYAIECSFQKICIVEEFIEGDEVSVESISWNGNHRILAITDKITTSAPFFVELEHHQPSTVCEDIKSSIIRSTINILNAVELEHGAGHTELKITKDGKIFAIEVGGRMGGDFIGSHLVRLSTGYDFTRAVLEICLRMFELPEDVASTNSSGVYFLAKNTERLLPYFKKENSFDVEKRIMNDDFKFVKSSNDRSGYLIYQSSNRIII